MSLAPLLSAAPVIQIHAFCAIAAFVLGAVVLFGTKGDTRHKFMGRVWVGLMVITAASAFFIHTLRLWGPFSPIHILSVVTLLALWRAVAHARSGRIAAHRTIMRNLYLGALVAAGLFTFYPGRIMNRVAFGPDGATPAQWAAFGAVVALMAAGAFALANRQRTFTRRRVS